MTAIQLLAITNRNLHLQIVTQVQWSQPTDLFLRFRFKVIVVFLRSAVSCEQVGSGPEFLRLISEFIPGAGRDILLENLYSQGFGIVGADHVGDHGVTYFRARGSTLSYAAHQESTGESLSHFKARAMPMPRRPTETTAENARDRGWLSGVCLRWYSTYEAGVKEKSAQRTSETHQVVETYPVQP